MEPRRIRRRINKPLTPEEKVRHASIRAQVEADRPRLNEIGRRLRAEYEARRAPLARTIGALKATREELGISLAELEQRTGIAKSNLSRLENATDANPTLETLTRYAEALGKELIITIADKE